MSELDVRIVRLEAMRVASVHAYSASPEGEAWDKLIAWAGPKGLLDDPEAHRIFGFDNPSPGPGSPNYGYEFWMVVGPDVEPEGEIKVKDFGGGLYAVTRCKGVMNIGPTWRRLIGWRANSKYRFAHHQCLEEHIGPVADGPQDVDELVMDLYMAIVG